VYFNLYPFWLGAIVIGILAFYLVLSFLMQYVLQRLFTKPFKLKGKALADAKAEIAGVATAPKPPADALDESDDRAFVYYFIDVRIVPAAQSKGFTHWEPGELLIAPADLAIDDVDDLNRCFPLFDVQFNDNGTLTPYDGGKYQGPLALRLHVGLDPRQDDYQFAYYFETFGAFKLSDHISRADMATRPIL